FISFLFFYYSAPTLPAPHSFPTRRSSDLARPVDGTRQTVHGILAARDAALPALRPRRATRTRGRDLGELLFARRRPRLLDERRLDRKSTRLNSSHSQISYAVFCLKKKKKS